MFIVSVTTMIKEMLLVSMTILHSLIICYGFE